VSLTPAQQIHANILEHLMATREWNEVRAAGTIGDVFNSSIVTIGAAENAIDALSAAVVAEINHLHELESGAAELFAQAARAREEAEELERVQQQTAEEIAAQAEQALHALALASRPRAISQAYDSRKPQSAQRNVTT
jgi:hypothetical protein